MIDVEYCRQSFAPFHLEFWNAMRTATLTCSQDSRLAMLKSCFRIASSNGLCYLFAGIIYCKVSHCRK